MSERYKRPGGKPWRAAMRRIGAPARDTRSAPLSLREEVFARLREAERPRASSGPPDPYPAWMTEQQAARAPAAPTPPGVKVRGEEEKLPPHDSRPCVTRSATAARDHDVARIVSDPHPGYRWI
jgi:hypothetical protein